jgi:hypothetical protein
MPAFFKAIEQGAVEINVHHEEHEDGLGISARVRWRKA